jgi:hypothetical protein
MSKIDTSVVWGPRVLGREKLDARRWAFAVEAPFDMGPEQIASLIGMIVSVDGATWTIRGVVPNIPDDLIRTGQPVEILVVGT